MFTRRREPEEGEINITAFMNLMIVLVPVLLMTMVFNHISILQLNLPDLTGAATASAEENRQLEVVVREESIQVFYPSGHLVKDIPAVEREGVASNDYETLSRILQELKRRFKARSIQKRDVLLLSEAGVSYQQLVSAMDTVRGFKSVVVTDVVEIELFPEISLGDAPPRRKI